MLPCKRIHTTKIDFSCRDRGPLPAGGSVESLERLRGVGAQSFLSPRRNRPAARHVSLQCPIGHRVDIWFENWTRGLRTYCRDAGKIDKTRPATLTERRRVAVTRRSVVARVIYAKYVVVQMIWQISRRAAVVVFLDSTTLSLSVGSQILWPMVLL
jgi:hypothetical protein